jgi:hypothetical protein
MLSILLSDFLASLQYKTQYIIAKPWKNKGFGVLSFHWFDWLQMEMNFDAINETSQSWFATLVKNYIHTELDLSFYAKVKP